MDLYQQAYITRSQNCYFKSNMVLSPNIMAFEQPDLLELSRYYHYTAEALVGHPIPKGRLRITDIEVGDDGSIRWVSPENDQRPLSGLALILKLKNMQTFRGEKGKISKRN